MEIPVLVRSLKSSILSSTSFQMGKTFWEVVSAAVEQSRRKANIVAQGDGKFGPRGWPQNPSKPKKRVRQSPRLEMIGRTDFQPQQSILNRQPSAMHLSGRDIITQMIIPLYLISRNMDGQLNIAIHADFLQSSEYPRHLYHYFFLENTKV